jgi:hypothetical protein
MKKIEYSFNLLKYYVLFNFEKITPKPSIFKQQWTQFKYVQGPYPLMNLFLCTHCMKITQNFGASYFKGL